MILPPVGPASAPAARAQTNVGADLLRRLAALLLDLVVLSGVQLWVNAVFGVTEVRGGPPVPPPGGGITFYTTQTRVAWPWLVLLVVGYFAVLESRFGATVGKGIARLRVTDLSGSRPTLKAMVLRNILRPIDGLPILYLLGGLLVLFSRRRQRLGDMAAGTTVASVESVALAPLPRPRLRVAAVAAGLLLAAAFSVAFLYFGRPPLVIEGLRNTGGLLDPGVKTYVLGAPSRDRRTVTYPIDFRLSPSGASCHGRVILRWTGFFDGWVLEGGDYRCAAPPARA